MRITNVVPNYLSACLSTSLLVACSTALQAPAPTQRPLSLEQLASGVGAQVPAAGGNAMRDLLFPPDASAANFGRGYDALLAFSLPTKCLSYSEADNEVEVRPSPSGTVYLKELNDRTAFLSEFNMTASMSLGIGPFASSATYKAFRSASSSSLRRTLVLRAQTSQSRHLLKSLVWTPQAIAAMNVSADELRRVCGTHVVVGMVKGGDFAVNYALVERTDRTRADTELSVTASVGLVTSGDLSLKSMLSQTSRHYEIEVSAARRGTNEDYPNFKDTDKLEAAALAFQKTLAAGERLYELLAIASPINRLAPPANCSAACLANLSGGPTQQSLVLEELAVRHREFLQVADTLSDMKQHPGYFVEKPDDAAMTRQLKDVQAAIDQIVAAAGICARLGTTPQACSAEAGKIPQAPFVEAKRKHWILLNPKTLAPQRIGEAPAGAAGCHVELAGRYRLGTGWAWVPFHSGYTAPGEPPVPSRLVFRTAQASTEVYVPLGTSRVSIPAGSVAFITLGDAARFEGDNEAEPDDPIRAALTCSG